MIPQAFSLGDLLVLYIGHQLHAFHGLDAQLAVYRKGSQGIDLIVKEFNAMGVI